MKKSKNTQQAYRGKKVYAGIDVHKKTYSVTVICKGEIIKRDTMRAQISALISYLKKHFKGAQIYSVYEAGFSGFKLHRELVASGIKNIVINPASLEVAANDKVKTDKRDSKKLADQLSLGRLKGIYIPSEAQEQARSLSRTREQIKNHRKMVSCQIKSKLNYLGLLPHDDKRSLSKAYLEEIGSWDLGKECSYALGLLIEQWLFLTKQLKEIDGKLEGQAQRDKRIEEVYRSVPGFGAVTSRVCANELGDLSDRFSNERKLSSFTGLTPAEYSSGGSIRRGNISRQGPTRIRKLLVEAAWVAIGQDEALKEIFLRIASARGKKRAIVAVARKLILRVRACFQKGCLYQIGIIA